MPRYQLDRPDELARSTHRLWCPCFQAWQPATADTDTCPAYGCVVEPRFIREAS